MGAKSQIDADVLQHASRLTDAEERLDIPEKQKCENEFIAEVESVIQANWKYVIGGDDKVLKKKKFRPDVMALSEACIFYEAKCTPEWLNLARHVIKDYLECRICVSKLPDTRLQLEFEKNSGLIRALRKLHTSILGAEEALDFVSQLPKLHH